VREIERHRGIAYVPDTQRCHGCAAETDGHYWCAECVVLKPVGAEQRAVPLRKVG
jgi:hypothetical protein